MNSFPTNRWPLAFGLAALSLLCQGRAAADDGDEQVLLATSRVIVREAADYGYRRWLRKSVWEDQDEAHYGLKLEKGWERAWALSPSRPLVVLVHGFNSTPERNAALMEPVRAAGYPCASFAYPNDWDVVKSAALLSRQLKELTKAHPECRVALVTHSMGGLVARACVEDSALDPGNVERLVMIAPPTHGTLLAHAAVGVDVWEHWLNRDDGDCWTRWRDSVVDGLGEAADDLAPGSAFLTKLNARSRNPRVRYAIFLGTGAGVSQKEMDWLRAALRKTTGHYSSLRDYTGKLDNVLSDMEEVVDGKGDGVVAIKRGRLDGVDDVVILPFGHLSCTGVPDCDAVRQVQVELLARLR